MRRVILTLSLLLCFTSIAFAGPLQEAHKRVVASGSTPATGGGGAGTVSYSSVGTVAHVETSTSIAVTAPANSSGDLLVAIVSDDTDQAVTDFDGFSLITSQSQSSHRLSVGYLTADGTTAYEFGVSGSTELTAVIVRLTKDQGTWNIQDYDSTGSSASDVTIPDLTVAQDGSLVLIFGGNDDLYEFNDPAPTDMTEFANYSASDPALVGFYQAVDTGTVTGKTIGNDAGGDITGIGIVVEATE